MRLVLLAALFCSAFVFHSCNITTSGPAPGKPSSSDKPYPAPAAPGVRPPDGNITLRGLVTDEAGNGVSGVDVYYYGTQSITNSRGEFAIPGLNNNQRIIVQFRKGGYFPLDAGFTTDQYSNLILQVALVGKSFIKSFSASKNDTIKSGYLTIIAPSNSFFLNGQPYTGQVSLFGKYIEAKNSQYYNLIQGHDLQAVDTITKNVGSLVSSGAFMLEALTSDGQRLTSEDGFGKTNINFFQYCIDDPAFSDLPPFTQAWYFDITRQQWVELSDINYNPFTRQYCIVTPHFISNFTASSIVFGPDPSVRSNFNIIFDHCSTKFATGAVINQFAKLTYKNGSELRIPCSYVANSGFSNVLDASIPLSNLSNLVSVAYYVNNVQVYKTINPADFTNPFYYTNLVPGPTGPYCPN